MNNGVFISVLQLLALAILFIEVFIPSMGLLFVLASILMIWSWNLTSEFYPTLLYPLVVANIITTPIIAYLAFKKLKSSPLTLADELGNEDGYLSPHLAEHAQKGDIGIVHSDLRPIGEIKMNKRILEAQSQGEWIPKGQEVTVIATSTGKIIVKPSNQSLGEKQ